MTPIKTLTVDGVEYQLEDFSDAVKNLVAIRSKWVENLTDERLAVAKTEAAIRAVDSELSQTVAKEIASKKSAEASTADVKPE